MLKSLNIFSKKFELPNIKISRVDLNIDKNLYQSYIPLQSQEYIQSLIGQPVIKITTNIIHIYTTSNNYKKLAKWCILFATFLQKVHGEKNDTRQLLTLYYLPDPKLGHKTILDIKKPLSPYEINSGLMFNNYILVYRREESAKVIIHELIHAIGLDKTVRVKFNFKIINSSVPLRFTETYTELLASILYTEYTRTTNRKHAFQSLFAHFEKQADKIMCIYGINDTFSQDTHVFEYIIAKHAFCSYVKDLDKIVELLESPIEFSRVLEKALVSYISNYKCGIRALPMK